MDPLIATAARALASGDPLAALKRVSLRDDPPALALRGIAMAQLGELTRATELLRRAARGFGPGEPADRARCVLARAEIALVSRELNEPLRALGGVRKVLAGHGDAANAAHAGYLEARLLLLIGRLEKSERLLGALDYEALPPASRVGYWLVAAGLAMRRIRAGEARAALDEAGRLAARAAIPALIAEVGRARQMLAAPAARLIARQSERLLDLAAIETLIGSDALIVDAFRRTIRNGTTVVSLAGRPVLFGLVRALAEAWPHDVPRDALLAGVFRARAADESHRGRLRVEMARLRKAIVPLAGLVATRRGFLLRPGAAPEVTVLAPPVEGEHTELLALLADGEAWASSALALALGVGPRTVQRALETLAAAGKAESFGRGPARRWVAPAVPGFPTALSLPTRMEWE